ncbi:FYN-binding protein 1 isoform X3 [Peromyscus maniculatus bairdii]|uniref:FYN-binding protein 1 isoform X3 n=1 Tax=Peromyscus maniculatus bairdii TaxID=230844 RepID=UPI003FD15895
MDGKTDVKSLMAKFNTGNNPTEEVSINSRPFKAAGQNAPTGIQARKNLFDSQGNASPPAGPSNTPKFGTTKPPLAVKPVYEDKSDKDPKPPFLKPSGVNQRFGTQPNSASRDPEVKAGFLKPVSPKPTSLTKEDPKPAFLRPSGNKLHNLNQESDLKTPGPKPGPTPPVPENDLKPGFSKVAGAKSKFMPAAQDADAKPRFPKHTFGQKPSLSTEDSQEEESASKNVAAQKGSPGPLGAKCKGGPFKAAREDTEDKDGGVSSSPFAGVVLKPAASRGSPGLSRNSEEKKEDRKTDVTKNIFLSKMNQEEPARFPKTPSKLTAGTPWGPSQEKEKGDKNSTAPKQKPLPPLSVLGPPPPKPSRPPNVDLTRFRKADSANSTSKSQTPYSTTSLPPPPASHPSSQPPPPAAHPSIQPPLPASHPTQQPVPSLPPRNIKPPLDLKNHTNEENQDGVMHSDGPGNLEEEQESEGETYEDIESSKERDKKREKEEKKRLELERKEQKEKEKKEQELRKKFKLTGPIQVIHRAKACCDVKGGKNELSFKQGDDIEIVRITDNPEGKWLGRTARGSYGYIKTTAVEIDYDSLKRKKNTLSAVPLKLVEDDQEVYDDVAEQDAPNSHGQSGSGGMFPPPPDDDIYDGIEEEGADDSFPSPPQQLDMGEEVYDDVDASDFPAPPAELSQGINVGKAKTEEKDPKKLKKQEKEEKDLRKKFKYDGEIRVLYSTKVASSITSKKWGARDLQIKPGESLEVIQSTDDTKVLCRNEEGKYGYVLRSYLADNDGEIYDDIADGCIYDND